MKRRNNGYNLKKALHTKHITNWTKEQYTTEQRIEFKIEQQIDTCERMATSASNKSRFCENGELLMPIHRIYLAIVSAHHLIDEKRDEVFRMSCALGALQIQMLILAIFASTLSFGCFERRIRTITIIIHDTAGSFFFIFFFRTHSTLYTFSVQMLAAFLNRFIFRLLSPCFDIFWLTHPQRIFVD